MRLIASSVILAAGLASGAAFAADKADISALEKAAVSMHDAIATAEKASGGKAIDVSFDDDKGGTYEITLINGDKTEHYTVNAVAKPAAAMPDKSLAAKANIETKGEKDALKMAKLSLSDAVAKAESETKGKAIGAELTRKDKATFYDVDVVGAGDKVMQVTVDAMNGTAVTKN